MAAEKVAAPALIGTGAPAATTSTENWTAPTGGAAPLFGWTVALHATGLRATDGFGVQLSATVVAMTGAVEMTSDAVGDADAK